MPAETVLVVDDHPLVLTTLVCTLQHAGFRVLSAASGEEALELASRTSERIDLTVCDVILPGMPGTELAQRLAEVHPETRYLFISGMPYHARITVDLAATGQTLLAKPFLPHVLLRRAREILGSRFAAVSAAF